MLTVGAGAGNMGSPSVPAERLSASESIAAVEAMMELRGHDKFDAMIGIEIGGSNGLQPLTIGSSRNFGVPTVDADWMGELQSPVPRNPPFPPART